MAETKWSRRESNPRPLECHVSVNVRRPAEAADNSGNTGPPGPSPLGGFWWPSGRCSPTEHRQSSSSPHDPACDPRTLALPTPSALVADRRSGEPLGRAGHHDYRFSGCRSLGSQAGNSEKSGLRAKGGIREGAISGSPRKCGSRRQKARNRVLGWCLSTIQLAHLE
jgi:hypothetical protein